MNEIVSGALASKASGMSFLELFLQAHIVVQAVMVGLLLASVISWAIVIEKAISFRRARRQADAFESMFWSGQSLEELYSGLAREQNTSMAALFVAAMREWKRSVESSTRALGGIQLRVEKVMDVTISREMERLERRLLFLATVGSTAPFEEYVELQAEISGVITELFVKEGDAVEKGTLLLKIDPVQTRSDTLAQEALLAVSLSEARNQKAQISVQETNVQREMANVRLSEVEVKRARQNLLLARRNFERKQELYEDNLIAADLYDAVKNDFVNAESALFSSQARLEQAQAQLAVSKVGLEQAQTSYESAQSRVEQQRAMVSRSQDLLSKTVIASPLAGVITQMNVEVGERAVPGTLNNPAATLMVIADLSVIEAEVEVDETDIVDLELGQRAEVKVDALPDTPIDGVVTEIGNSAIQKVGQQQEAKDFKVVIQLKEPPASLRPGLELYRRNHHRHASRGAEHPNAGADRSGIPGG